LGERFGSKPNVPSEAADFAFDELCFSFGIELDDVTSEREMQEKETGSSEDHASNEIIYKIEIPANRYDLLCVEGLARALRIFLGKEQSIPNYHCVLPKNNGLHQRMLVRSAELRNIRPYVVCAVLRDLVFNKKSFQSFIDLQEKLHQNIGRRRTLVSIGTHDLDTIQGPFTYDALPPKQIKFAPLNSDIVMDAEQLMEHIDQHDLHLKKYLPIIRDSPLYPVITDSKGIVLSLPPIINGDHSKITLNTHNVFIEVTATDLTKANIVLNTVCAMFSEYCSDPYSVESVEVCYDLDWEGNKTFSPELSSREIEADVHYITRGIGNVKDLSAERIASLLNRMSLLAKVSEDRKKVNVSIPCTRTDILHPCDILEDVAIAYGFNNVPLEIPKTSTIGRQHTLNKVTDLLRLEVALSGFSELLTLALCSRAENFELLQRIDDNSAITIANPKTFEFQVGRTTLLVGLLKTIGQNRKMPLPLKVFEIADVMLKDSSTDVGSTNQRNLCAVYCAHTSGFEVIHGLLDRIMLVNNISWKEEGKEPPIGSFYQMKPCEDDLAFFPGRGAVVLLNGRKVGVMGVLHPNVLNNFHIPFPCSAIEISIEPFV